MNIEGRVSLQMALFWGLGLLFIEIIFSLANRVLYRIQGEGLTVACTMLSIFMAINLIVKNLTTSDTYTHASISFEDDLQPLLQFLQETCQSAAACRPAA